MFTAGGKVLFGALGIILVLSALNIYLTYSLKGAAGKVQPTSQSSSQPATPTGSNLNPDLFSSQTATVRGKITGVSDNKMTIENDKGVRGDLEIGKVLLLNSSEGIKVASSSADLKQIKLNQSATITLVLVGDKYLVSSITF